jgi:hypothetical protein
MMGYYDRDDPVPEAADNPAQSSLTQLTPTFVRLVGIVLLLVGVWVSLKVIVEAWELYRSPQSIERFAVAIERGSNLDKALASITSPRPASRNGKEVPAAVEEPVASNQSLKLSYFLSWGIALMLLMLVGRLALAAVKTGGELALYDTQVKKVVQTLIKELGIKEGGSSSTRGSLSAKHEPMRRKY